MVPEKARNTIQERRRRADCRAVRSAILLQVVRVHKALQLQESASSGEFPDYVFLRSFFICCHLPSNKLILLM